MESKMLNFEEIAKSRKTIYDLCSRINMHSILEVIMIII